MRLRLLAAGLCMGAATACLDVRPALGGDGVSFNRDVRPILSDRCFRCHGPDSAAREAELRLDRRDVATESVIVPGDAEASELIARIESDDPDLQMPPAAANKPPLSAQEKTLLRSWINDGAQYEAHWAYLPVDPPPLPAVRSPQPARNAIDLFVVARQEQAGLRPAEEAPREVLCRRLYLDLIGLPPTPAQTARFVADASPDADRRLVVRLLDSPAFGERMASWWFDLVRFANTVGYHGDQGHAIAPYRDYVIKSFHENLPFDQFTIEQLAGDLLPEPTMWQRVATGYNRLLQTTHEGGAQDAEYRAIHLADRVRNVSETWLGSSLGCAQCHDHKFDPFTQRDFYSLGAFFADVDHFGSFEPVSVNELMTRRPPEILAWTLPTYEELTPIERRISEIRETLERELPTDWEKLRDELAVLERRRSDLRRQFVPTMITRAVRPHKTRVLARGDWQDRSGEIVEPNTPGCLPPLEADGRRATRLDLARWLVSAKNPLTSRVIVNRLWRLYFGRGLTSNVLDIGSQTPPPLNQELLDWLAVEFVASGWDVKHLVKLIVTSRTYQQASQPRLEIAKVDPDNLLWARQNHRRLDAEQVRDSILSASGLLSRRVGGDYSRPYQPAGYYSQLNFPEREYQPSTDDSQHRRAVYMHWQRQYLHPMLMAFDAPTREECTAERPVSDTPSAALVLLNDPTVVEAARVLAAKVTQPPGKTDAERISELWERVLSRRPTADEVEVVQRLLVQSRQDFVDGQQAEKLLAIGLTEFKSSTPPQEVAAWTTVCRALFNLHETITRE